MMMNVMDLQSLTTQELERLLEILPEEIRRRESTDQEADDADRRKRSVFASFQELAKKQGINFADL
jgi:DNA-binding protein H-NS